MNIFNLPDLGEGLPDAEIHQWFVKKGDSVTADQTLVSMETAKAVVDLPSPQAGIISKLYGKPGDLIKTGEPLVAFVNPVQNLDKGTVVGNLEENTQRSEDVFTVSAQNPRKNRIKATPGVKMLAKKLGVDLSTVQGSGEFSVITRDDVQAQAKKNSELPLGYEPLRGVRRAMLSSMLHSHAEVVPVSIFDEADLSAWNPGTDITVRLIRALIHATKKEPALNAWFDSKQAARQCFTQVHLGLAMDNDEGLFVPVIHDTAAHSDSELRQIINELKQAVSDRTLGSDKLKGASIILSNFGKFSGRFASPIIIPPMVAILAVGKLYQGVVATTQGEIEVHKLLPLSLSFDHRAVTGGEAARFLAALIDALQQQ